MSSAPQTSRPAKAPVANTTRSTARRDQLRAGIVGVVCLAGSILLQSPLRERRSAIVVEPAAPLRRLAIEFPRLALGGFRGLLATILWKQAEDDKAERRWEQLETKYDIIGALQPYFVSVYIFHSWNQAYNLSAQWHTEDIKYKWVLDGQAYLYKGEEYNPDNPDILLEQGHLYFLKLGSAFERIFYRAHWRADIARMYELENPGTRAEEDKTVALKHVHDFVLKPQFNTTPLREPGNSNATRAGWGVEITDAELFKDRTDGLSADKPMPFRYGLSPFYFAYVEYKRCLAAGAPTTTGLNVIDAWPAMSLRLWCRDDLYYSQQTMNELFTTERTPAQISRAMLEIRDCHRNVQMIAPRAVDAFEVHLLTYNGTKGKFDNRPIHRKHIRETIAYQAIGKAESALFEGLVKWKFNREKITPDVAAQLSSAIPLYEDAIIKSREWVDTAFPVTPGMPPNPDRADFEKYRFTLENHIRGIETFLKTEPGQKPDLSFLDAEIVEK